jgi:hypothetical protein
MDQWQVNDSHFTKFVEEVQRNLETYSNKNSDFILESEHSSESEKSASGSWQKLLILYFKPLFLLFIPNNL